MASIEWLEITSGSKVRALRVADIVDFVWNRPLTANGQVELAVQLRGDSDYYRFTVSPEQAVKLHDVLIVGPTVSFVDDDDESLPITVHSDGSGAVTLGSFHHHHEW